LDRFVKNVSVLKGPIKFFFRNFLPTKTRCNGPIKLTDYDSNIPLST